MILGTKARYAVMTMAELASHKEGMPVRLSELALAQGVTVPYLEQIFSKLKQCGLVQSVRGPGGGYRLARPADKIRISDVVSAVNESLKVTRCAGGHGTKGCMATGVRCITHDLWEGMERQIHDYLHGITLDDLVNRAVRVPGMAHAGEHRVTP